MHARRRIASRFAAALLLAVAVSGCAPKRIFRMPEAAPARTPSSSPSDLPPPPSSTPSERPGDGSDDSGSKVIDLVKQQIGTPYAFGGCAPEEGFDCSGLVRWAYQQVGVNLPRTVRDLAAVGEPVTGSELRPGDLVFFSIHSRGKPDHVGIYDGRHRFVHAPRQGHVVRSESLNDGYWRRRWTSSRRVN